MKKRNTAKLLSLIPGSVVFTTVQAARKMMLKHKINPPKFSRHNHPSLARHFVATSPGASGGTDASAWHERNLSDTEPTSSSELAETKSSVPHPRQQDASSGFSLPQYEHSFITKKWGT